MWRIESRQRGGLSKRELRRAVREGRWICLNGCPVDPSLRSLSQQRPVRVGYGQSDRDLWIYRDWEYSSEPGLTDADILALINRREADVRGQVARAHAHQATTTSAGDIHGRAALSTEVKMQVWRRDGGRCVACGSNANLEYDHIIPVSMGGSSTMRNLQLLCMPCNRAKGASLG